ncbi:MAG: hypothetical protein N3F64_00805 [Nitrososphaeria archaeon]|nr:hypothetical protein [Nitrososphaeria archaeon]
MSLYQSIVEQNIGILKELDELDKIRLSVMSQLGILEDNLRLKAALIFQWIFRLYTQKMGEAYTIKMVRKMIK